MQGRRIAGCCLGAITAILLTRDCAAYEAVDNSIVLFEKDQWSASCSKNAEPSPKKCGIVYNGSDSNKLFLIIGGTNAFIIFDGVPETAEFHFAFDGQAPWTPSCRRVCYFADLDFVRLHESLLASRTMRIESAALGSNGDVVIDLAAYREAWIVARAFAAAD